MCGICGIAPADGRAVDPVVLRRMTDAIRHRGPDSDGYYESTRVGLGIRRLAIIDVKGGDQPIANEDLSSWIVLNGEIYNYPDLRSRLDAAGHSFRTRSDTECILHLYEDVGDHCVDHLRGMYAFAIWDGKAKRLLVARDRLGQKPIYYSVADDVLYFCSELGGLLTALPAKPPVDLAAIGRYLSLQYIPEPYTVYRGVFKLPPAHTLVWESGQLSVRRYWDFAYEPKLSGSIEELAAELRDRVREAVRIRLMSEVPLGAHLSGGIDSSVVVALMSQLNDAPVKTFSVGFEEEGFSELDYARSVAERYETEHHEFKLAYGDLPDTLGLLARHFGEPFADPSAIPLYHLSVLTRQSVTVALNGDGGDEDFAGYQRYWLDPLAEMYVRFPHWLTQRALPAAVGMLPVTSDGPTGTGLLDGIKRLGQVAKVDGRASILRWGSYFSSEEQTRLWRPEFKHVLAEADSVGLVAAAYDRIDGSKLDRTLYADTHTYLPGDLLVKADRMTMAASLEGRSPFLDHELVAWAARLPDSMKVRGLSGKYLLRHAFAEMLPKAIRSRGKQGFGIPLGAWFRGPLADWARGLLLDVGSPLQQWFRPEALNRYLEEHAQRRQDHGKRLYALSMLAIWAAQSD
jgi:asparagine synthase (glutamine-hydrolysing)